MIAVIYRWHVDEKDAAEFQRRWHEITVEIVTHHGGGGSRLHRAENGEWVAYARWPSRADRDRAFADFSKKTTATPQREGMARLVEEIWMEIVDDLLIPEADLPPRFH